MSFVFRTPEVDSLERGPLQGKRRNELFSMAIERGILTKKVCKEHGIPVDKKSTREYMLTEYEKVLQEQ